MAKVAKRVKSAETSRESANIMTVQLTRVPANAGGVGVPRLAGTALAMQAPSRRTVKSSGLVLLAIAACWGAFLVNSSPDFVLWSAQRKISKVHEERVNKLREAVQLDRSIEELEGFLRRLEMTMPQVERQQHGLPVTLESGGAAAVSVSTEIAHRAISVEKDRARALGDVLKTRKVLLAQQSISLMSRLGRAEVEYERAKHARDLGRADCTVAARIQAILAGPNDEEQGPSWKPLDE